MEHDIDQRVALSRWYASLYTRRVDLVGDYAGAELFLIEGDSLLLHAFSDPLLDFSKTGFQLLHAAYNVEKFLKQLSTRGCKFHIAFFEDHRDICFPEGVAPEDAKKYLLARVAIIQHLQRNVDKALTTIRVFESIEHSEFLDYLHETGCYFVLCHDGTGASEDSREQYQWVIHWLAQQGWNVALINGLECHDTKIMTMVLEDRPRQSEFVRPGTTLSTVLGRLDVQDSSHRLQDLLSLCVAENGKLSEREVITMLAAHDLIEAGSLSHDELSKFLLHTAALDGLPLHARYQSLDAQDLKCDLADLVDGKFYSVLMRKEEKSLDYLYDADGRISHRWKMLGSLLAKLHKSGNPHQHFTLHNEPETPIGTVSLPRPLAPATVLPFSHPVLDPHLAPIHLEVDNDDDARANGVSNIFKELSHWHNAGKPLVVKGHKVQKLGFFAHKRNQKFMTEVRDYAASLTNAVGQILDPEIIVVKEASKSGPKSKHAVEAIKKKSAKPVKQVSNKEKAHAAAAKSQALRDEREHKNYYQAWDGECKGFARISRPDARFVSIDKYFNKLSKKVQGVLQAEVTLYKMISLYEASGGAQADGESTAGGRTQHYIALIWDLALALSKSLLPVPSTVAKATINVLRELGLPQLELTVTEVSRQLPFKIPSAISLAASKKKPDKDNAIQFQLAHCGPYLDRSFDSQSDSRVPFKPDAWQRKVLNAIDEQKSLLVIAPTSAGKTFISFYAMKQVLELDDDGVLVYVAPTKALVNQIAAEVQARFSKSVKHDGRSVWAIHTRDYRINNPTGCQVLVTVPHILQIMLLAPSHAKTEKSWSNRVQRIIFDEVHCIGQAEDGLIWEQLLLLAPCPIIALSATVGNPEALASWLESTQKAIGNEFVVVRHETRYSDLRKFIFHAPEMFTFQPLQSSSLIKVPGLDGTPSFGLVHPVSSLVDRTRGIPEDLSMEARDCLSLYRAMIQHQTEEHVVPHQLHPSKALPLRIKKSDVLAWEIKLKQTLLLWMHDTASPYPGVLDELSRSTKQSVLENIQLESPSSKINAADLLQTTLPLLVDLHRSDALPAIIFNFDRSKCEAIAQAVVTQLQVAENKYKESSAWRAKIKAWEEWKLADEKARKLRQKNLESGAKAKKKGKDRDDEDSSGKMERLMDAPYDTTAPLANFDPELPVPGYHFTDQRKCTQYELDTYCGELRARGVQEWLMTALYRGIGVHHAGMNRKYRQIIEMLFRKGFLRVVVATGTLALGINMPCKTVVFAGDSVFLTALNFRQAAGRAGRRGFDVLGNVVFQGITPSKVSRLLSSRLPDLNGHFPITTSLVLRLFTLLHETKSSRFARRSINALLSQPRLYLGGDEAKMTVLHHLRFSIEYLRRQALLGSEGEPLNFAGLVSHLYYTENSGFAFHALLKGGYFHHLCSRMDKARDQTLRELMLTLSHLFARLPMRKIDRRFAEEVIKISPSNVILSEMPSMAKDILQQDQKTTLEIYRNYVSTFVHQHITDTESSLPFSNYQVAVTRSLSQAGLPQAQVKLRSAFVALSGHDDRFADIHDLCSSVRDGVFLEEHVIPHIDASNPEILLNAYLLDFFKHGDVTALVKANKIRRSEVWYRLNDFSLILATIIASIKNFMGMQAEDELDLDAMRGLGDVEEEIAGDLDDPDDEDPETLSTVMADEGKGMVQVLAAFEALKQEFDAKFKIMWA